MGKIFLTSDTHFNHLNILRYESETRPFSSIEEMNEAIIANWNSVVSPEDTVYHLGDFFMGRYDAIEDILDRLNGTIKLIRGNHDTKPRLEFYKARGIEVKELDYINYKGRFFILCHFPNNSEEFVRMITHDNSEVVWCYGHVHSNAPKGYHDGTFHVGMDTNDLTPISLDEIWEQCWPEEIMTPTIEEYKCAHKKNNECLNCSKLDRCFIRQYGEVEHPCPERNKK